MVPSRAMTSQKNSHSSKIDTFRSKKEPSNARKSDILNDFRTKNWINKISNKKQVETNPPYGGK